jgi:hypothetical protein
MIDDNDKPAAKVIPGRPWLKPFPPGVSGNPSGRAKGSRNKLAEAFIADLHEHWLANGKAAIKSAFEKDPVAYLRVIARVIPQEIKLDEATPLEGIPDELLNELLAYIRERMADRAIRSGPGSGGDARTIEARAVEAPAGLSAVPEAGSVSRAWPDVAGEVASRGKSAREDARGRDGNGDASDRALSDGLAGPTVQPSH